MEMKVKFYEETLEMQFLFSWSKMLSANQIAQAFDLKYIQKRFIILNFGLQICPMKKTETKIFFFLVCSGVSIL